MLYFFNVVKSEGRLQDIEGGSFDNDGDAQAEAQLVVREIIGRELIGGKTVEWTSIMEVVREDATIVAVFTFREALKLPQDS